MQLHASVQITETFYTSMYNVCHKIEALSMSAITLWNNFNKVYVYEKFM